MSLFRYHICFFCFFCVGLIDAIRLECEKCDPLRNYWIQVQLASEREGQVGASAHAVDLQAILHTFHTCLDQT